MDASTEQVSPHSKDAPFTFSYLWYKICWHFFAEPDIRLIESLILQLIFLVTFVVNTCSFVSILRHTSKHKKMHSHWSVTVSLCCLFSSILIAASNFLILIYQQDGRHFDHSDYLCRAAALLFATFLGSTPFSLVFCHNAFKRWNAHFARLSSKYSSSELNNYASIRWLDIPTGTPADMDMRYLIAVQRRGGVTATALIDESTNQVIADTAETSLLKKEPDSTENTQKETELHGEHSSTQTNESTPRSSELENIKNIIKNNDFNKKYRVVYCAHKGRWKLFLLGFVVHLILGTAIQYKNYFEEKQKLFEWGYRFSRLMDSGELAYAKWERAQGIKPDPNEQFEELDFLEHFARMKPKYGHR